MHTMIRGGKCQPHVISSLLVTHLIIIHAQCCSTSVLIHCPHRRPGISNSRVTWSEAQHDIATLTLSHPVTALQSGKLIPNNDHEILIIGSPTHILAYHVDNNSDVFYKEIREGCRAIAIGMFASFSNPIVLIGGNSCIKGFNHEGNEIFWVVTAANVNCLVLVDINRDGKNELIVGSDDSTIRIYREEHMIHEFFESSVIQNLVQLGPQQIAYTVNNGTVGVYEETMRLWRIKSKNRACAVSSYDLLGMGSQQLITGWDSGKIDVRDPLSGDVLFKFYFPNGITGIVRADYRGIGKHDLICCSKDGEVRGFSTSKTNLAPISSLEQEQIKDLMTMKQAHQLELQHYESNAKFNREMFRDDNKSKVNGFPEGVGIIPANTRLQIGISTNIQDTKSPHIEISVSTNNSTIIRAVLIFAEGLFTGETLIAHPVRGMPRIIVPLNAPKDFCYDVHIKAFVGYLESQQFHVFELTRQLPKFSMYAIPHYVSGSPKQIAHLTQLAQSLKTPVTSYVSFKISERIQRICMWINQNFLLPADIEPGLSENNAELKLHLVNLRNGSDMMLHFGDDGAVSFYTTEIEVAGNLIQSLAEYLNVDQLASTAHFSGVTNEIVELFRKLEGLQITFKTLNSDVSQKINDVKNLIIRAEDARGYDVNEMLRYYSDLMGVNDDIVSNYTIRLGNISEIQKTLKRINEILQIAIKLRVGKYATNMMKLYKEAVKTNNVDAIVKIIETGTN